MKFAAALVLAWLSGHGYDNVQRDAAFVAARGESRLNPDANSGQGDYGLYQWRGPRKRALASYQNRRAPAIRRDRPELDREAARLVAQLEFMDREWRAMPESRAFFLASERHQAFQIFCEHYTRAASCR